MSTQPTTNKGGRPPKPSHERMTEKIEFRVTASEFDAICRAAMKRGEALGAYLLRVTGFRTDETCKPFTEPSDRSTLQSNR